MCASVKISIPSVRRLERRAVFSHIMCVSAEINTCSVQRLERKAVFNRIMCASGQISTLSEDWKEEQQWQSKVWWLNTSKYQLSSDSNRRSPQWSQHWLERQEKSLGLENGCPQVKVTAVQMPALVVYSSKSPRFLSMQNYHQNDWQMSH